MSLSFKFLLGAVVISMLVVAPAPAAAQKVKETTGAIKGRVRVDAGADPSDIKVVLRQGEREVAHATT
ncbi:MAG TPA: hypothetical protein VD968_08315, partial [Pyrinomonadaceae bacterium]|nr:hypothetical protein [Pyrinomonadaceae bacterium]